MRESIMKVVKNVLIEHEDIAFSYFFGSFTKEEKFSDIDIGIYLLSVPDNIFILTSELKHKISRKLIEKNLKFKADDVDIVVMNLISFTFLRRIFKEGRLILDRAPHLRTSLIEKNSIKYRECLGLLSEAGIL